MPSCGQHVTSDQTEAIGGETSNRTLSNNGSETPDTASSLNSRPQVNCEATKLPQNVGCVGIGDDFENFGATENQIITDSNSTAENKTNTDDNSTAEKDGATENKTITDSNSTAEKDGATENKTNTDNNSTAEKDGATENKTNTDDNSTAEKDGATENKTNTDNNSTAEKDGATENKTNTHSNSTAGREGKDRAVGNSRKEHGVTNMVAQTSTHQKSVNKDDLNTPLPRSNSTGAITRNNTEAVIVDEESLLVQGEESLLVGGQESILLEDEPGEGGSNPSPLDRSRESVAYSETNMDEDAEEEWDDQVEYLHAFSGPPREGATTGRLPVTIQRRNLSFETFTGSMWVERERLLRDPTTPPHYIRAVTSLSRISLEEHVEIVYNVVFTCFCLIVFSYFLTYFVYIAPRSAFNNKGGNPVYLRL